MTDIRLEQADNWIKDLNLFDAFTIEPLAGDASFRRYFRVWTEQHSKCYVLMDAPPDKEDVQPFLRVDEWLRSSHVHAPEIIRKDLNLGFLLLEDFGDTTWSLFIQNKDDFPTLFEDALRQIHLIQQSQPEVNLPLFDTKRIDTENNLYLDWYLPRVKHHTPSDTERESFHQALAEVVNTIDSIPKAPVHLDYHSRNLMLPDNQLPLGIIDFQDAVMGPITYDLASLLYDCYQDYPESERRKWSTHFFLQLSSEHKAYFHDDFESWHKQLRLTALQRHIKAIGIFARLAYRDNKLQFLDEMPLTRKHIVEELEALSLDIPLLNHEPQGS